MRFKLQIFILAGVILLSGISCSVQDSNEQATPAVQDTTVAQDPSQLDVKDIVQDEISCSRQNAITHAIANVSPAVVGINVIQIKTYQRQSPFLNDPFWGYFFPPQQYNQKVQSLGSGFLIAPDGYILTNQHVVHNAVQIIVTTTDGQQHDAALVGASETYDVALLKIEGESFPFIPLGESEDIIIGEWVIALGNPFGLFNVNAQPTVTVGVVSAVNMDFKGELQIENRLYDHMIQTDASINGGNSGGPLVNSLGKCIGINTFIISGQSGKGSVGIGFAIPINRVKKILPALKNIKLLQEKLNTGLEIENLSPMIAYTMGIRSDAGVIVTKVKGGSPAQKAGVEAGDVIVMINGLRVRSTSDVDQINRQIDVITTTKIDMHVFRKGKIQKVTIEFNQK